MKPRFALLPVGLAIGLIGLSGHTLAGTCDPKGGISTIGIEASATNGIFGDGSFYYEWAILSCQGGKVVTSFGWTTTFEGSPKGFIDTVAGQQLNMKRAFRNACGNHLMVFHDNYKGTVNGVPPMSAKVIPGSLYLPESPAHVTCTPDTPPPNDPNTGCDPCTDPHAPVRANPIHVITGNKFQRETDYFSAVAGGLKLVRAYNSLSAHQGGRFGRGWSDSYYRQLVRVGKSNITYMPPIFLAVSYIDPNNPPPVRMSYTPSLLGNLTAAGSSQTVTPPYMQLITEDGRGLRFDETGGADKHGLGYTLTKLTSGWELKSPDNEVSTFLEDGRLSKIKDVHGLLTVLAYDDFGRLKTVTDPYGRTLGYAYNDDTFTVKQVTLPGGVRTFTYGYDSQGRLTTVTDPDQHTITYHYEDLNFPALLTGITDADQKRYATWRYDSTGRATSSMHGTDKDTFSIDYSATDKRIIAHPEGYTETLSYDLKLDRYLTKQETISCTGCLTRSTTYGYDANGHLASSTDAAGRKTSYVFDATRNLETSRTEASGTALARTITTEWWPNLNLPKKITEPGRVTEYAYDSYGHPTLYRVTDSASSSKQETTLTYEYTLDAAGQPLLKKITVDGPRTDVADTTLYEYDAKGLLSKVTNALNQVSTYSNYNDDGQVGTLTDPNGVVSQYTYSNTGLLKSISRSKGGQTQTDNFEYYPSGQLKTVRLAQGRVLTYVWDAAHYLTDITDGVGNTLHYERNAAGQVLTVTEKDATASLAAVVQQVDSLRNPMPVLPAAQ